MKLAIHKFKSNFHNVNGGKSAKKKQSYKATHVCEMLPIIHVFQSKKSLKLRV